MIVDIHTHLFPEDMIASREKLVREEPDFQLLYEDAGARLICASDLIHSMEEYHVDTSVALGFPWRRKELFMRHNDMLMDAAARYPEKILAFGCFDIRHPDAAEEAQRCLSSGMAGLGELAVYDDDFTPEMLQRLDPVMAVARSHGSPVLIHVNEPVGRGYPGKAPVSMQGIENLIRRYPANTLILAHWGGGIFFFGLLKKKMKQIFQNVYVDTAASPYLYDPMIYELAVRILGPEKILFGSDFPLIPPPRYFSEMARSGMDRAVYRAISGRNACRLLGIREKR